MTSDKIIKLIQDNGLTLHGDIEHFAALVRNDGFNKHNHLWLRRINEAVEAERDACAKMIDELDKHRWKEYSEHHTDYGDNIRARNNT